MAAGSNPSRRARGGGVERLMLAAPAATIRGRRGLEKVAPKEWARDKLGEEGSRVLGLALCTMSSVLVFAMWALVAAVQCHGGAPRGDAGCGVLRTRPQWPA